MEEEELKKFLKARVYDLIPRHIITDDITASISYLLGMSHGIGRTDDIDHLGNRRIRSVGELLQNQIPHRHELAWSAWCGSAWPYRTPRPRMPSRPHKYPPRDRPP